MEDTASAALKRRQRQHPAEGAECVPSIKSTAAAILCCLQSSVLSCPVQWSTMMGSWGRRTQTTRPGSWTRSTGEAVCVCVLFVPDTRMQGGPQCLIMGLACCTILQVAAAVCLCATELLIALPLPRPTTSKLCVSGCCYRGGGIELSILSKHYGRVIAAYDIQTKRCDR